MSASAVIVGINVSKVCLDVAIRPVEAEWRNPKYRHWDKTGRREFNMRLVDERREATGDSKTLTTVTARSQMDYRAPERIRGCSRYEALANFVNMLRVWPR